MPTASMRVRAAPGLCPSQRRQIMARNGGLIAVTNAKTWKVITGGSVSDYGREAK